MSRCESLQLNECKRAITGEKSRILVSSKVLFRQEDLKSNMCVGVELKVLEMTHIKQFIIWQSWQMVG